MLIIIQQGLFHLKKLAVINYGKFTDGVTFFKWKLFLSLHEKMPEEDKCLFEQGFFYYGVATCEDCGALYSQTNITCIWFYWPVDCVCDQGSHFLTDLASIGETNNTDEIEKY